MTTRPIFRITDQSPGTQEVRTPKWPAYAYHKIDGWRDFTQNWPRAMESQLVAMGFTHWSEYPQSNAPDQTQPQAATASETPETQALVDATLKEHADKGIDDFMHYMLSTGIYVYHARSLETRRTRANALCDKLAEALEELLDHGSPVPNPRTGEPEPYQSNPTIAEAALAAYRESKKPAQPTEEGAQP